MYFLFGYFCSGHLKWNKLDHLSLTSDFGRPLSNRPNSNSIKLNLGCKRSSWLLDILFFFNWIINWITLFDLFFLKFLHLVNQRQCLSKLHKREEGQTLFLTVLQKCFMCLSGIRCKWSWPFCKSNEFWKGCKQNSFFKISHGDVWKPIFKHR